MSIDIIKENYEKALKCFYSMGNKTTWHRDETKGWHYLLNAYYEIIEDEITDHLLYAKILKTLAWESRCILSNYEIMKKYLSEAKIQFEMVLKDTNDDNVIKDYEYLMKQYRQVKDELDNIRDDILETDCFKLIKKNDLLTDFYFGDGVIKSLNINRDDDTIIMEVENYKQIATFKFSKVYDIVSDFDIVSTYIDRLFIYKPIDTNHIQFDIGFAKILCDEIEVLKIVDEEKQGL